MKCREVVLAALVRTMQKFARYRLATVAALHNSPLRHFTARSGRHDTRLQHETGIFIVQITTASGIVILTQIAILFRKVKSGGSMI